MTTSSQGRSQGNSLARAQDRAQGGPEGGALDRAQDRVQHRSEESTRGGARIWIALVIVVVLLVLLFLRPFPGSEPGNVDVSGPTDAIPAGQYAPWVVGDSHVHTIGDSGIVGNNRCRPHAPTGMADVMGSIEACSARLADSTHRIAAQNGLDWAILIEHGPWLGSPGVQQCDELWISQFAQIAAVAFSALESTSCVRHVASLYSHNVARNAFQQINGDLMGAPDFATQMLIGQELGTAAGISILCAGGLGDVIRSTFSGPGHVGIFTLGGVGEPIDNRITDCREDHYLRDMQERGLYGSINHPDNGDGGSDWHCWNAGDLHPSGAECEQGLDAFTRSALAVDAGGAPLLTSPAIVSLAMTTDDKPPSDGTKERMLSLLQGGTVVGFTGGSDSHAIARNMNLTQGQANDGKMGLAARTYALAPGGISGPQLPDDPAHPVRFALSTNATVSSLGPLLQLQVESSLSGGTVALPGSGSLSVALAWPEDLQWPYALANSKGFEVVEGEFVPRASASHRPATVDLFLVPIDPGCGSTCAPIEQVEVTLGAAVTTDSPFVQVDGFTDVDAGLISLQVELPDSPVDRWAIVASGNYDAQSTNSGLYVVDSWASPVWVDGAADAVAFSTDDSEWGEDVLPLPVLSTGDFETETMTIAVTNQEGDPVPDAAVQLHVQRGSQMVPLPARSSALAAGSRYRPMLTGDDGLLQVQALPATYAVSAVAPRCPGADEAPSIDLVGAGEVVPLTLTCLLDDALPVTFEPIMIGATSGTVDVDITCSDGGEPISTGRIAIPVNEETELLQVPRGWDCSGVQYRDATGTATPLTELSERMDVGAWGARFSTASTRDPQPASFVVESVPLDPSRPGGPIDVGVWCEGDGDVRTISVAHDVPAIVDGLTEGQECGVRYSGDRLAPWSAPLHQVVALGNVVGKAEAEAEGIQVDHADARFSVVTFHVDAEPTDWEGDYRPPDILPTVIIPPVVVLPGRVTPTPTVTPTVTVTPAITVAPAITVTPRITVTPTVTATPTMTPTPTPSITPTVIVEPPGPTCPAEFTLRFQDDVPVCVRRVDALVETIKVPVCPDGFEQFETECERTVSVDVEPVVEVRLVCPEGSTEHQDGERCFEVVRVPVDPITVLECPPGSVDVGGGGVEFAPSVVCRPIQIEIDPCVISPRTCRAAPSLTVPQLQIVTPTPRPRTDVVDPVKREVCPPEAEGSPPDCFRLERVEVKRVERPEPICPDDFKLVDQRCVGTRTESTPIGPGTEERWSCPPGTQGDPSANDPFCFEVRDPV